MTEELKHAAQQALEALRANAIHYGDPLRCSRDAITALERALTQRPAAQTEQWLVAAVDAAMVEMKNISPPLRRSECERLIRAAAECMPTPQQATPDLADGPARMHWTNWMPVKDALEYAYQKMGLEMVKTDAGAKYPNLHWNLAGLVREFVVAQQDAMFGKCQACGKNVGLLDQIKCLDCGTRLCEPCAKEHFGSGHGKRAAEAHGSIEPTTSGWVETSAPPQRLDWSGAQQATPEPVGEVVAYREKLTGRLCEPEDTHRRKFPMCYEPLTRPAPGVPEVEPNEMESKWCWWLGDDEQFHIADTESEAHGEAQCRIDDDCDPGQTHQYSVSRVQHPLDSLGMDWLALHVAQSIEENVCCWCDDNTGAEEPSIMLSPDDSKALGVMVATFLRQRVGVDWWTADQKTVTVHTYVSGSNDNHALAAAQAKGVV